MTKFIQKYLKLMMTILLLTIILIPAFVYTYQSNIKEIEKNTWAYWEKGDERRGGLVITNSIKEDRKRKYITTSYYRLISTSVLQVYFDTIQFETFYLERTGINSFRVKESVVSTSTAYTFDEAIEIAKKYDVYKNNPAPDKIFNHPELNSLGEKQRKQEAEELKLKQAPQYYGYSEEYMSKWFLDLKASNKEKFDIVMSNTQGKPKLEIVKWLIKNGYLPQKPGYPVD